MNLIIESMEGDIYLAFREEQGQRRVVAVDDTPIKFSSINQAHEHFRSEQFEQVWLEHNIRDDEMVGLGETVGPMRIPLNW